MSELDLEKLKKLLGTELTEAELKEILENFEDLPDEAEAWARRFAELRQQPLPPLSPEFTAAVLAHLSARGRLSRWWEGWAALPRFAKLATAAVAVLLAVYVLPPVLRGPLTPGFKVLKETSGPSRNKIYQVRFAIQKAGAQEILLLGDFNEWQGMILKKNKEDIFHAELPLNQGTYAYGFLVDGKQWVPDPSAPKTVPDGYGNYNSLINL